jgi:hypothetical protein
VTPPAAAREARGGLRAVGVRWFLFGARAAILHDAARLSADVDVTVDLGARSSRADLVVELERILASTKEGSVGPYPALASTQTTPDHRMSMSRERLDPSRSSAGYGVNHHG